MAKTSLRWCAGEENLTEHPEIDCVVRRAKVKDFSLIADLDRRIWRDLPYASTMTDSESVWRLWCEYAHVYVAFDDSEVVGVGLMFSADSGSFYILHKFFVRRSHRGVGVGKRLMACVTRDLDFMHMECRTVVSPENEPMLKLTESFGFTNKVLRQNYFREEEDQYVLRRLVD